MIEYCPLTGRVQVKACLVETLMSVLIMDHFHDRLNQQSKKNKTVMAVIT